MHVLPDLRGPLREGIIVVKFIDCPACDGWAENRNGNSCLRCGATGELLMVWIHQGWIEPHGLYKPPMNPATRESYRVQQQASRLRQA